MHLLILMSCFSFLAPAAGIATFVTACAPKKKAKAKPKAALDHGELNRMLSSLRYQASDRASDEEKKKAAKECQQAWAGLVNQEDKKRFLKMWEDNGRGKTADSLKFAVRFEQECEHVQGDEYPSRDK